MARRGARQGHSGSMIAPSAKPPRTSRVGRSMMAGVTAARVGAKQVRHRLRLEPQRAEQQGQHEAEIGRLLFHAVSQLRGTALKASQILGMYSELLPEGVRTQLARATHQAMPLNRALVSRAFRQAMGQEPQDLFASFDPEATAAASLGQVHRATLKDGTVVAVKIQYPGIAQTIDTDLRLLRLSLRMVLPSAGSWGGALPGDLAIESILAEIRSQLDQELDYRHEAREQAWFATHTALPGIVIAAPVLPLTCTTVLTQPWLRGAHVEAWLKNHPSRALRDGAGQLLFDWFTRCAFLHRRIHADFHPGNLFADDGTVGVLDFGCTRALSPAFIRGLARSWSIWLQEPEPEGPALLDTYRAWGAVAPWVGIDDFVRQVLPTIGPVLDWATQPMKSARFDFVGKTPFPRPPGARRTGEDARGKTSWMANVPPEMLSFDRAWFGLMHLLTRLGARVDTRAARALIEQASLP
jgi:predicted unusual protein kinase regulating ubiquinone biosynthesis (AarF/ABC1/UbiB family)